MAFFRPEDVQQPQGSLAALGGGTGRHAPIYNPVQPPQNSPQLGQPNQNDQYTGIDWDRHLVGSRPGEPGFDPNKGFNQILYPGGQLPPGWQPNTGGMNPNGPQPVPGMPPRQFDGPVIGKGFPGFGDQGGPTPWQLGYATTDMGLNSPGPPVVGWTGNDGTYHPPQTDPRTGQPYQPPSQGNRGSGQPINQPMSGLPFQSMATGSLQSLGGGQQSIGIDGRGVNSGGGMVNLRGPDGSMKAVPQDQLQHWLSKGATQVGGGGSQQGAQRGPGPDGKWISDGKVSNGWGGYFPAGTDITGYGKTWVS